MYKHRKWEKKVVQDQLSSVMKIIAKEGIWYSLKSDILFPIGIKNNIEYIGTTIETFHAHRKEPTFPIEIWNKLKELLNNLRPYDKVMIFENEKLLFHSYCILSFINTYLQVLISYDNKKLKGSTVAILNGEQAQLLIKARFHRKYAFSPDCFLVRYELLTSIVFRKYFSHTDAMNHFINSFCLFPPHQVRNLQKTDDVTLFINRMLFYFGTTNVNSPRVILKSLAIVLAEYMTSKMEISKKKTFEILEEFFSYFIYDFCYEQDDSYLYNLPKTYNELTKNVYIKHRVNLVPIFGSSQSPQPSVDKYSELDWLFNDFENETGHKFPKGFIKDFQPMRNPVASYLGMKPMELLQEIK